MAVAPDHTPTRRFDGARRDHPARTSRELPAGRLGAGDRADTRDHRQLAAPRTLSRVDAVGTFLGRLGLRAGVDLEEMWRGFSSLSDGEARAAFIHTLRTIVDPGGQRVNATDRLYLAAEMPLLFIWG